MFKFNPILACDSYKLAHRRMYPEGTEVVYSNFTPRSNKYFNVPEQWKGDSVVVFGLTGLIKEMVEAFNEEFFSRPLEAVMAEYCEAVAPFCGVDPWEVETAHIEALHELGYLPLLIKALPEGTLCPMKVPMLTVRNTQPDGYHKTAFAWVTNYLETWLSTEGWKPCTSATTAYTMRKVLNHWAEETGAPEGFVQWQGHDFSMRGMSGIHDAARSGAGHLLSFTGSDTILAAEYLKQYYAAEGLVAGSVPASEHSVMTMGGVDGEFEILDRVLFDVHPSGIVSVVSDSYDFWAVMSEYIATRRERILARTPNSLGMAKCVLRPDSGNPVEVLCGIEIEEVEAYTFDDAKLWMREALEEQVREATPHGEPGASTKTGYFRYEGAVYEATAYIEWNRHDRQYYYIDGSELSSCNPAILTPEQKGAVECLWDVFGGTLTEKGYKVLHERIGLIYGDSITIERADEICRRLAAKGFASTNCVFGVGSYTYQMVSRDTFGMAMKATYGVVKGEPRSIFKAPKTDPGKHSAKGLLCVVKDESGKLKLLDDVAPEQEKTGELKVVFKDGAINQEWLKENTLAMIRQRLAEQ